MKLEILTTLNSKDRDTIFSTVKDIERIKIQGASQVRKAIVNTMKFFVLASNADTADEFKNDFHYLSNMLAFARPNETDSRTALRIFSRVINSSDDLELLKKRILNEIENYEENRKKSLEKISKLGKKLLPKDSVVLTHCHSHTVEDLIAYSKDDIKMVYCTETRPLFQGRITAKNLLNRGLNVTQIVDSGAYSIMRKVDYFFTGCDSITPSGAVLNKIGTAGISLIAKEFNVPHYVVTSSHSFEVTSLFGFVELIEKRSTKEVWEDRPDKLNILNPAFDVTPSNQIAGFITEYGVQKPKDFINQMKKVYSIK